jgi:hypothetical protein
MNHPSKLDRTAGPAQRTLPLVALGFAVLLASAPPVPGEQDEPKAGNGRSAAVGKVASATGSVLERQGKEWRALRTGEPVHAGRTLVALPHAGIDGKTGAARLEMLGNLAQQSRYPVLEAAAVLHEDSAADLDFTLDRGRVEVVNRKEKGAARVKVRFRDQAWGLELAEPGTRVSLELYGRWGAVPFHREPKLGEGPSASVVFFVLHGQADVSTGSRRYALTAPPGPAYFHWDSENGPDPTPGRLETIPDWADPKAADTPEARERERLAERIRKRVLSTSLRTALDEAINARDPAAQRAAVYIMGATDDLPGLIDALSDARHPDARATAVVALRHWIGRAPGQDLKLYKTLVDSKKFTAGRAEIVLQLLHSFSEVDRDRPETYETLIAYLDHPLLPVRELAKWHLYRLVPAAKDIEYDSAGAPAERERAQKRWKELVPPGKLPPRSKPSEK